MISYGECVAILGQFEKDHPAIAESPDTLGVRVAMMERELVLKIVRRKKEESLVSPQKQEPTSYQIFGRCLPIRTVEGKPARFTSSYPAGGFVCRDDTLAEGTIGWNFAVRGPGGLRYCFVSNWHVLTRGSNDASQRGSARVQNHALEDIAVILDFDRVEEDRVNYYDYALAQYLPERVGEVRAAFETGLPGRYPMRLATSVEIDRDHEYFTNGWADDWHARGHLLEIGSAAVERAAPGGEARPTLVGTTYRFRDQLFFQRRSGAPMTERGDSGSVIVQDRGDESAVAGLAFAVDTETERDGSRSATLTIANPLFLRGWQLVDALELDGDRGTLPVLELDSSFSFSSALDERGSEPWPDPHLPTLGELEDPWPGPPPSAPFLADVLPPLIRIGRRVRARGPAGDLDAIVLEVRGGWVRLHNISKVEPKAREIWVHANQTAWSNPGSR